MTPAVLLKAYERKNLRVLRMKCCIFCIKNVFPVIKISIFFSTSVIFFLLTAINSPLVCSYDDEMTLVVQLIIKKSTKISLGCTFYTKYITSVPKILQGK